MIPAARWCWASRVALALDQLRVPDDRGQRLVELVRGSAGQLGDERLLLGQLELLLRVEQALLHADALAQIGEDADGRDLAIALVDDRRGHAHRHDLAGH